MKSKEEIKKIESEIEEILYTVMDPEVELNIVDLGLLYSIVYDGDKKVDIIMTLSTPTCPLGDAIVNNVKHSIYSKFPEFTARVEIVFDPPWSQEMISEAGKMKLGM
ncbi:MAG: DUF59 domain-containing protein [Calditrichaeota bacterium]|nr:MAG: DUF59 domain-containing protein [Calditrichota bacterium]MBL1204514.1 DUF59 domain-containing protein [Calditrichota bacterium]NOG44343.1 DUF59 domain-containing protein [Calditrichota bacterium]